MTQKKSPYDLFSTDASVENQGITLDFGDFAIRIARAGGANKKYAKALVRILKPYRKAIATNTIAEKKQNELMAEVYAETVILDWVGVNDKDGVEMPFNKENCVKLLTDLPVLFQQIMADAENFNNFKAVEVENVAKN